MAEFGYPIFGRVIDVSEGRSCSDVSKLIMPVFEIFTELFCCLLNQKGKGSGVVETHFGTESEEL
jgi:hypothetical protein